MRVLMISKALVLGTAQRKLEELAKYPDIELVAVTPPYWLHDDGNKLVLEHTYPEGYKMIVTPIVFNGHYHTHYYPELGRIIGEVQPDLVHMDEEPYNFATFQAIRLARKRKIPAFFFAFQNLYREYPPPFRQLEQYNYRHTEYAQAGNSAAAEVLKRKGYKGQIRVIAQFGADPAIHFPVKERPARGPDDPFILGYAGRLKPEKGLPLIIEALASLPDRCRAVFVGSGPLREDLERQAAALGVADRVTFKGSVPSYKVPDEMRQMDVLLLPSLTRPNWAEQFGRVLVEAMCCEIPVIGSDSGEIPFVIGDAGLIFPEGNAQELAARVRQLLDDPALYTRLATQGRQRVLENFTQEAIAKQTYKLYLEMLANKTSP